jgi:hypothetical protein
LVVGVVPTTAHLAVDHHLPHDVPASAEALVHRPERKYTDKDARDMKRWLTAAEVMGTIAVVISLPVLSSLLAQAAVRYSQRRTEGQRLNLGQLLTLADRGWADVPLFLRSVKDVKFDSPLLWLGAVLMFIGELMMILN